MKKFTFKIPIGDWSADGHGISETFRVKADKDMKAVEKAYKVSSKKLPGIIHPTNFCDE